MDIWRVKLLLDGPAKVHLKPNVVPHSRNPHSRWSSPVLIVPKPKLPNELRMTADTRDPNSHLIAIAGCLPILEVIVQPLNLAWVLSSFDTSNGFWQFPLNVEYQEIYSLLTDVGIFTPERIVPGSAVCCSNAFWLGSMTYWSTQEQSFEELLQNMRKFFERLRKFKIWDPKRACCLRCISSGVGVKYPTMDSRSILPTSRDLQNYLGQKRVSSCRIYAGLSTGSEARFHTMSVTWHLYQNSWNAVKNKPVLPRLRSFQGFL